MLEVLEYYQSLAEKFDSRILTIPGIVVVLVGLCVWLAGLRWRRVLGALAGTAIAGTGILVVGDYSAGIVLTVCTIGLAAGVIINRIVLGIFGAIVGAGIIMMILTVGLSVKESGATTVGFSNAGQTYNPGEITAGEFVFKSPYPTWPEYEQSGMVISAPAAMEITTKMAEYFVNIAKEKITSADIGSYAGAGFAAVIIVLIMLAVPRVFISVIFAIMGTGLIFIGMIILLFYKMSEPITYIAGKLYFYSLVFGAMAAFGTFIQLILSPPEPQTVRVDDTNKKDGEKK
jgi:hypothetical protein